MPGKTNSSINILSRLVFMASLAACVSPSGDQDHGQHHPRQSSNITAPDSSGGSAAQGGMGGGAMAGSQAGCRMMDSGMTGSQGGCGTMGNNTAAGRMQQMDKESMCAMYRSMRDAPTEQARQAMMDRNMQGMSIEMRERHMEMMRHQCQ